MPSVGQISLGDLMLHGVDELSVGECYFDLFWHERDDDRYPCIETRVYVGMDTQRGKREYYFQEVESYLRWGNLLQRAPSRRPKAHGLVFMAEDVVLHMLDLRGLAGALTRLHLSHSGLPLT
jgi:hypothetical protein